LVSCVIFKRLLSQSYVSAIAALWTLCAGEWRNGVEGESGNDVDYVFDFYMYSFVMPGDCLVVLGLVLNDEKSSRRNSFSPTFRFPFGIICLPLV